MRHETNAEFLASVNQTIYETGDIDVGACPGCAKCGLDHIADADDNPDAYESASEGDEFSTHDCDSCGSSLAGKRLPAHVVIGTDIYHIDICVDCAMFHANGELPFSD